MIVVHNLTKRFGRTVAVDDLSFAVRAGTVTGFLGPNGSGKSTTMRCMLGLDRPDGGGATFDDRRYDRIDRPLHEVGALLDAGYVHPGRTGRNHLRWLAASNHLPVSRVDEVLALVGMETVGGKRCRGYSLGMRQRLGLAGVLLGDPHTVILDEPANGLDPEGIRWIRDVLSHLAGQGRTVLVSSHLLSEMALIAKDLVVIGQGRLLEQCSVDDFVARYAEHWVRFQSPSAGAVAGAARSAGIDVQRIDEHTLELRGVTCAQVGEIAAAQQAVVHELSPQSGSLEDAFLRATARVQEYSAAAAPPIGVAVVAGGGVPPSGDRRRGMIDTLRSEWIKLRTVRMNWVMGIVALAFPLVVSTLTAALKKKGTLRTQDIFDVVTGTSVVSALLLGVVAASGVAGEFGFGTIRPTFAATPRRMRVVGAKAIVTLAFSAALSAVIIGLSYSASSAIAKSRDVHLSIDDVDAGLAPFVGLVVLTALLGLLGLAIGLLVRHAAAAVAILILWPLLVENLIAALLSVAGVAHPAKLLPYISGFQLASSGSGTDNGRDVLGRVAGGFYFGAVVVALLGLGAVVTARRDA